MVIEARAQFSEHSYIDNGWLRQAEDSVLYEMSRRYHNNFEGYYLRRNIHARNSLSAVRRGVPSR